MTHNYQKDSYIEHIHSTVKTKCKHYEFTVIDILGKSKLSNNSNYDFACSI